MTACMHAYTYLTHNSIKSAYSAAFGSRPSFHWDQRLTDGCCHVYADDVLRSMPSVYVFVLRQLMYKF